MAPPNGNAWKLGPNTSSFKYSLGWAPNLQTLLGKSIQRWITTDLFFLKSYFIFRP